ncbi:MAG: FHA domain-containing protein, partial [Isosphaeraceae bacterium]
MKVELVVVQGNPDGKRIHLTIPVFRIGRGETCHLRPNSERVSREHAEFAVKDGVFTVRDLGSRNG